MIPSPNASPPRRPVLNTMRSDHENAARYEDVAHKLRLDSAAFRDWAESLGLDVDRYDTFAPSVQQRVRPLLSQLADVFAEIADGTGGAQGQADTYRSLVDGRYGATA